MRDMLIHHCRLCGSMDVEKLRAHKFQAVEGVSFLDQYDVCVCNACGCGFAGAVPEQAAFNRYYRVCSKYDGAVAYNKRGEDYYALRLNTVQRHVADKNAAILEIGCAMGHLLSTLRDSGFTNVAGAEPSPECAAHVSSSLGIPCVCASIDDLDASSRYDAVLCMAVLEHCCDLDGTMRKLASLLNDNGCLFFEVPDVMRFSVDEHPPFQEFSIEHINYFSARSLANLANLHGLTQIATRPCPDANLLSVMRKTGLGGLRGLSPR